jgi:hypothetical protein
VAWVKKLSARVAGPALFAAPFAFFWKAALGRVLLAPDDAMLYLLPMRLLTVQFLRAGVLPLWNPFLFSGVPYLAEIQTAVLYPPNLLFFVLSPLWAMNLQMISTYSIAALGMYAYARAAGCSVLGAGVGGLVFAFNGFTMGHLGHTGVIQGAAWMPLLLYSLERLRHVARWRYVALGAVSVALSVFAGQPQMPFNLLFVGGLYGVYFAVAAGAAVSGWRYLILAGTTLATGVLLAAAQLVPTAELVALTVRSTLPFDVFTMLPLPLAQTPMLLVPFLFGGTGSVSYWGAGPSIHEILGYAGLAPLMLVLAALPAMRRERWTWFWLGLATFAFLMTLGARTPLAWLMYHVPVYDHFRVAGRHFLQFDLALAVLAAWSVTRLGRVAPGWAMAAPLLVCAAVLTLDAVAVLFGDRIWAGLVATVPGGFHNPALAGAFAAASPALALPAALAVLSAAAVIAFARRSSAPRGAALVAVLCLDLGTFGTLLPHALPAPEQIGAVPDFIRYLIRTEPEAADYRLAMMMAGEHEPARSDFALLGVPMINGYEPLMLRRYARLTSMTYFGVVDDALVAARPLVLDVLNTRYLAAVYPGRLASAAPQFASQDLGIRLRSGERAEFTLPVPCPATALAAVSAVRGADVRGGVPVARFRAVGEDGRMVEELMRTSRDGGASADSAAAAAAPELPVSVPGDFGRRGSATRLTRFDWQRELPVRRVSVELLAPGVTLHLKGLSLFDAGAAATCPLTTLHTLVSDSSRWRRIYGNGPLDLLRNRRSLPRAWLVPRTLALASDDVVRAVQSGRLPDGRPFDPRNVALVEDAGGLDLGALDPNAQVRVTAYDPNSIELRSRSRTPAFLVLSEIFYPGWKAEIDGATVPIVRTDYVLRGIFLPAGKHRVRFLFRPRSVAVGFALSTAALLALLGSGALRLLRRRAQRG